MEDLRSPIGLKFDNGEFFSLKAPSEITPPMKVYLKELHKRTGNIAMPVVWNHLTTMCVEEAEMFTYLVLFRDGFIKYTKLEALKL